MKAQAAIERPSVAALANVGVCSVERPSVAARRLRGQAAMEYLVTYGWALLALLIVLVALVSSGIFSPSRFFSEECNFQPTLPCSPFILYSQEGSSTLLFSVRNGMGFPVRFSELNVTLANGQRLSPGELPSQIIGDSQNASFSATLPSQLARGSQQTLYVQLSYVNCLTASTNECEINSTSGIHVASGRILANVQGQ